MEIIKKYFYKLKVLLGIEHPAGFTQLMYKGKPVILKDDAPVNKIGFYNEKTHEIKVLDIKTGKITKGNPKTWL